MKYINISYYNNNNNNNNIIEGLKSKNIITIIIETIQIIKLFREKKTKKH